MPGQGLIGLASNTACIKQLVPKDRTSTFKKKGKSMFSPVPTRRLPLITLLMLALGFTMLGATNQKPFPDSIPLPNGFQPEGITHGSGTTFYVGSIPTGAVYHGDLSTGSGEILVPAQTGRSATGMKYDPRSKLLFVSGGMTGMAYIYDGVTGANVAEIQLSTQPSFINDVVVTKDAAYFTNSFQPVLYKVPLDPKTGSPTNPPTSIEIHLGGDFEFISGGFNANGIDALPNGKALIIVNSTTGTLYKVDPVTGYATRIDLGAGSVPNGDGILLQGKILYVVQNSLNQIAVIKLDPHYNSGVISRLITSPLFRVPTTIARFGSSLYAVNARFGTPPTPDTDYDIVRVSVK
jgi:sugar lactone lactonase YvrE